MPRYIVKILGRNFLLKFDTKWERLSFFTHRFADAPDPLLAEHVALEDFRASKKYCNLMKGALYAEDDPPELGAAEVSEVAPDAEFEQGPPGLIFYDETSSENAEQGDGPNEDSAVAPSS